ncbi:hypothetical protein V1520DRAFT_161053 [Lipomyces starkeyi]|uniref:Uncharacterized protein n=1 Tax=Lipomyces starkeyi NRRL Y-11557 TaxID=675824 RepID=A0A1E3Q928_LIPST|nr:hypothetical protein LIPSTDRAFT_245473 [Lipomyces starkeyi NRRL Y-11557]
MSTTEVPLTITTKNVTATFKQNKDLSSSVDEVLKAQGISWTVRTALKYTPMSLNIHLYLDDNGVEHLDIDQLLPAGIKSDEPRTLDFQFREKLSVVFGPVIARSKRVTIEEAAQINAFLGQGWDESCAKDGLFYAYARGDPSKPNGLEWESHQTFGFADVQVDEKQTERKYVVRLYFTAPSLDEGVEKRLVYDFVQDGL